MESSLREYNSPRKRNLEVFVANTWQHLPHLLLDCCTQQYEKCKQWPVYGVFWPLLPHPSTDRNETRNWSSLPPRNLPIKFPTNPSTIFLVIMVTDRQIHSVLLHPWFSNWSGIRPVKNQLKLFPKILFWRSCPSCSNSIKEGQLKN